MLEIIEKIVSVTILILGLSYFFQAKLLAEIATEIFDNPQKKILISAVALPFGLIIILGHNVWVSDWPVVITIFGWMITIKSAIGLLAPQLVKLFANWSMISLRRYIAICGVITTVLGALLVYQFYFK